MYNISEKELIRIFKLNQSKENFLADFIELFEKTHWGPKTYICECIDNIFVAFNLNQKIQSKMTNDVYNAMLLYASGYANGQTENE